MLGRPRSVTAALTAKLTCTELATGRASLQRLDANGRNSEAVRTPKVAGRRKARCTGQAGGASEATGSAKATARPR